MWANHFKDHDNINIVLHSICVHDFVFTHFQFYSIFYFWIQVHFIWLYFDTELPNHLVTHLLIWRRRIRWKGPRIVLRVRWRRSNVIRVCGRIHGCTCKWLKNRLIISICIEFAVWLYSIWGYKYVWFYIFNVDINWFSFDLIVFFYSVSNWHLERKHSAYTCCLDKTIRIS